MDIQEVSYYALVCHQDGYWINQIFESLGCNLEEYLFTSPHMVERFLKEKFIPLMDEVCEWPLHYCPSDLEYRRHPSGAIDIVVNDSYTTISRAFQSRTVTVNKVKKVVVVDGDEYVREVEEKTYGEWTEVKAQVEVTFYRYRKGLKIVG
jgi:hypothetical protein